MMADLLAPERVEPLRSSFGERLEVDADIARFTSMQVGGTADYLLRVRELEELQQAVRLCWTEDIPFLLLGGGSNVLVSDAGIRQVVLLNRAKSVHFKDEEDGPRVWAESGANFGSIARRAANRGWSGLEWAEGIPGTVGGAVVNNAGAHGSDLAGDLHMADILHRSNDTIQRRQWSAEDFAYDYRSSLVKRGEVDVVILAAEFLLERSTPQAVKDRMREISRKRRESQPQGATMGSMFKNPPGDYAGRLIDEAGLKGTRRGDVEISPVHANFFINHGGAKAIDVWALIKLAQQEVKEKFGIDLELEIELVGEW